ncbi:pyridoxamine 5'-phosphate oxidase family protein [Limobrevibacterium gyesilva]|uniref:Pyridoxamine 5'-phosphate oxidase family protein n=1 Tax=Limobrevibacterium gyesilva TaxID=2991712 RepID=A0AA42CHD7_9PROT|nr:pyridoxamine 5'-phosphate oxidase family protein [Limobrevibacterium gyesilva]MCW3477151.1 pyridoxamine 5'-phosphate oxidase family protein [Limobrevibacterium gyesilva]
MDDDTASTMVWKLIGDIGTCMMVTNDDAWMRCRPMAGIARPDENAIWFYTDRGADKDNEVRRDPRVCLAYSDVKAQSFVSVSGRMEIVHDRRMIEELWNPGAQLYYPEGPDDPNILLLRFTPEFGEYWDAPSSKIVLAIKFLQAKISGDPPELGRNAATKLG